MRMTGPARYGRFLRNASAPGPKLQVNDFFNEIRLHRKMGSGSSKQMRPTRVPWAPGGWTQGGGDGGGGGGAERAQKPLPTACLHQLRTSRQRAAAARADGMD